MKQYIWPALFLITLASACSRTERGRAFAPNDEQGVVARVNGVAITADELDLWAGRGRHGEAVGQELKAKALESLVTRELMRQEAYKLGLDRHEPVAGKLAALRAQYLAAQREELGAAYNAHLNADGAAVSDAEAARYFDAHAAEMRSEYHLMQIAYAKDPAAIAEARRALDAGTPFETVAAKRFEGLPVEQRPWDLGYLRWSQLSPEWRDVVAKLRPGEASDVIKGAGERWWIVFLADKRVNEAVTAESERQVIVTMLQTERAAAGRADRLEALRKNADISYAKP